jgi:hypothetical protein
MSILIRQIIAGGKRQKRRKNIHRIVGKVQDLIPVSKGNRGNKKKL